MSGHRIETCCVPLLHISSLQDSGFLRWSSAEPDSSKLDELYLSTVQQLSVSARTRSYCQQTRDVHLTVSPVFGCSAINSISISQIEFDVSCYWEGRDNLDFNCRLEDTELRGAFSAAVQQFDSLYDDFNVETGRTTRRNLEMK